MVFCLESVDGLEKPDLPAVGPGLVQIIYDDLRITYRNSLTIPESHNRCTHVGSVADSLEDLILFGGLHDAVTEIR